MSTTTATVQSLTAEVRVLKVGSRQVTQGVYDQLDRVSFLDLTPFGRVKPKGSTAPTVYIVGVNANGELCRSSVHPPSIQSDFTSAAIAHWARHANKLLRDGFTVYQGSLSYKTGSRYADEFDCEPPPTRRYEPCTHLEGFVKCDICKWLDAEDFHRYNDATRNHSRGDMCGGIEALHAAAVADATDDANEYKSAMQIYRRAEAQPLIILAGLR